MMPRFSSLAGNHNSGMRREECGSLCPPWVKHVTLLAEYNNHEAWFLGPVCFHSNTYGFLFKIVVKYTKFDILTIFKCTFQ